MSHLVRTEFYKLKHDRFFWLSMLGMFIGTVVYTVMGLLVEGTGVTLEGLYAFALEGNPPLMMLVPCALAGSLISSEHSWGTMKNMATSGNSRLRIYFAKLIVFSIGVVLISLVHPIVLPIVGAVLFDVGSLPEFGFVVETLLLTVLFATALASIMAAVAIVCTNSGVTIGVLFLIHLTIVEILSLWSKKSSLVAAVYDHSVYKLLSGIHTADQLNGGEWLPYLLVPTLTFLVFGLVGGLLFQRMEIK